MKDTPRPTDLRSDRSYFTMKIMVKIQEAVSWFRVPARGDLPPFYIVSFMYEREEKRQLSLALRLRGVLGDYPPDGGEFLCQGDKNSLHAHVNSPATYFRCSQSLHHRVIRRISISQFQKASYITNTWGLALALWPITHVIFRRRERKKQSHKLNVISLLDTKCVLSSCAGGFHQSCQAHYSLIGTRK